jgi:hypothetical protein
MNNDRSPSKLGIFYLLHTLVLELTAFRFGSQTEYDEDEICDRS